MVNEIIALSLGLTAGTFFFLAATFPALTIPLLSIAVTGVSTLILYALLKVINTLQAIPQMVDDVKKDANEKYEDLKKTSVDTVNEITKDFQNMTKESINKASTDFQKIATDTCNQSMSILQQKVDRADLISRKLLVGGYVRQLCLSTEEIIEPQKEDFIISASTTTGLAAKTGTVLGLVGAGLGTYFLGSPEIGGSIGATVGTGLGAGVGATYGGLTNRFAAHSKAFVRKIDTHKLHCLFLNDQTEIQQITVTVNFLGEGQDLTQNLLNEHETLILDYITHSSIQRTNSIKAPYADPKNIEPEAEELSLLALIAKKPIIFQEKSKTDKDKSSKKAPKASSSKTKTASNNATTPKKRKKATKA